MHKLPAALLPRYPAHQEMLKLFVSAMTYHNYFPAGLTLEGEVVTVAAAPPIFASEFLEKITTEILIPTLNYKKFQTFLGQTSPLTVPFVKDILVELDSMYAHERAREMAINRVRQTDESVDLEPTPSQEEAIPVSQDEAKALQDEYGKIKDEVRGQCAEEHVAANVVFVKWSSDVLEFIASQPMLQDGASCLWFFNGGTDCTKDPARRLSAWKMKGVIDEDHCAKFVDVVSKMIRDGDTAIVTSGRNAHFFRDIKKLFLSMKPKMGVHEGVMEPEEAAVCKLLRLEANAVGSVDLTDPYLQIIKHPKMWKSRKPVERRFVPGNTAFKAMAGIPVLGRDAMTTVPFMDREAIFKSITPSDKWNGKKKGGEDDEGCDDDDDDAADALPAPGPGVVDESSLVPLFLMELHPRVRRHVAG